MSRPPLPRSEGRQGSPLVEEAKRLEEIREILNEARHRIYWRHWKITEHRDHQRLQSAADKAYDLITEVLGMLASRDLLPKLAEENEALRRALEEATQALQPYLHQHNLADRDRHCVCSYCNAARQALESEPERCKRGIRLTPQGLARRVEELEGKANYLVRRVESLARALDRAITTIEYQGGGDLIAKELRRVFYDEALQPSEERE